MDKIEGWYTTCPNDYPPADGVTILIENSHAYDNGVRFGED